MNDNYSQLISAVNILAAKVENLEKIMTAQGGERASDLLTKAQVAERLKVSERTVDRMVERGKLHPPQGTRNSKRWRVKDIWEVA